MEHAWQAVGLTGQALFFARFFVQWYASERAGESVAPRSFWWLSLAGTLLVGAYTLHVGEAILLPIFGVNLGVYVRNLMLGSRRFRDRRVHPGLAAGLGLAVAAALILGGQVRLDGDSGVGAAWRALGIFGSAVWSTRFLLQWFASERAGRSEFPPLFWVVSLVGNLALLGYALRLGDPVYIAGFLPGPLVQARNLMLGRGRVARQGAKRA